MPIRERKTIRFRRREEPVLETLRVRGKTYFVLENLSHRGAFRVFDSDAGPGGDYRVLYRFAWSETTRRKIEVLRRMAGPKANRNMPQIVQCARQNDDYFVVLSWVWGTGLGEFLDDVRAGKVRRPQAFEVVRLLRGLAHGLGHFHRQLNLIHGDVSPANILLTDGTRQLVLVDFGSAWPTETSSQAKQGDGVTVPYAAPERLANHALEDFRADQFSIGVVAYELLTLEVPYDELGGRAGLPQLIQQMQDTYRDPTELIPLAKKLPRETRSNLDALLRTSLALHPDQRFPTRKAWLGAWDDVWQSLQHHDRLTTWEKWLVASFENVARIVGRNGSKS